MFEQHGYNGSLNWEEWMEEGDVLLALKCSFGVKNSATTPSGTARFRRLGPPPHCELSGESFQNAFMSLSFKGIGMGAKTHQAAEGGDMGWFRHDDALDATVK